MVTRAVSDIVRITFRYGVRLMREELPDMPHSLRKTHTLDSDAFRKSGKEA